MIERQHRQPHRRIPAKPHQRDRDEEQDAARHERAKPAVRSQARGGDGRLQPGRHRHNGSNQPVATLRNRLEEVWRFGVIAESLAQFGDGPGQRGLAHHSRAPEVIEQPFFGHDFTRVGRQVGEQIHDLCPHLDDPTGARQPALVRLHQPVADTELAPHGLAQYAPFPGWRLSDCGDSTER